MGTCPPSSNAVTCFLYLSQHSDIIFNKPDILPSFGAESFSVTVSGFSSGSYMAHQVDVIYSDLIQGVGLLSGGSYGGNLFQSQTSNDTLQSINLAKQMESQNMIAPLVNGLKKPVWIHSGLSDNWIPSMKQKNQRDFYLNVGAQVSYIETQFAHTFPQINTTYCIPQGYASPTTCGYDAVGQMLSYLLTNLKTGKIPSLKPMDLNWRNDEKGVLRKFSQWVLTDASILDLSGIDEHGYIFYPKQCADGTTVCKLHIHFHGCGQSVGMSSDGWDLLTQKGFNEYAVSNNLIVVFPQISPNLIYNPLGCWDFYGYSSFGQGQKFLSNTGIQPVFIKNIINRILSPYSSTNYYYFAWNLLESNGWQSWFVDMYDFVNNFQYRVMMEFIKHTILGTNGISATTYQIYSLIYSFAQFYNQQPYLS